MQVRDHLRLTGGALREWFITQSYDAVAVGVLWLIGLEIIGVPYAPFFALLGMAFQFIPNIGPILGLVGPAISGLLSHKHERAFYVLILYAIIIVVDGLILQPFLMKKRVRVPIWASLIVPIVLGILIPFWGVIISAPLLAIVYAYVNRTALKPPVASNIQESVPRKEPANRA
jgi:predicted PurR-regulated permease PerM